MSGRREQTRKRAPNLALDHNHAAIVDLNPDLARYPDEDAELVFGARGGVGGVRNNGARRREEQRRVQARGGEH